MTKRAGLAGVNDVWSYPNVHGDVVATANTAGVKQAAFAYDPDGNTVTNVDNSPANYDYAWLGPTSEEPSTPPASPPSRWGPASMCRRLGRFLSVDPVEGGRRTTTTTAGDPVNCMDTAGSTPSRDDVYNSMVWLSSDGNMVPLRWGYQQGRRGTQNSKGFGYRHLKSKRLGSFAALALMQNAVSVGDVYPGRDAGQVWYRACYPLGNDSILQVGVLVSVSQDLTAWRRES